MELETRESRDAPWLKASNLELNQLVAHLVHDHSNHATNWLSSRSLVVSRGASRKAAFGTRLDQPTRDGALR